MLPYTIRVALKLPRGLLRAYTEVFTAFSGHAQLRGIGLFESIHSYTFAKTQLLQPLRCVPSILAICRKAWHIATSTARFCALYLTTSFVQCSLSGGDKQSVVVLLLLVTPLSETSLVSSSSPHYIPPPKACWSCRRKSSPHVHAQNSFNLVGQRCVHWHLATA